jgi:sulfate permease, SulP family
MAIQSGDTKRRLLRPPSFPEWMGALRRKYLPLLERYVPIFVWLPTYRRAHLAGDLLAGIIVAMVLVPTAMAYALLAGLPPQYGLYGSIAPALLYSVFSRSPLLSVAPVTVTSLMVGSVLSPMAPAGSATIIEYALILACLSGLIFLVFGICRLGSVVNFVGHPIINGFISAVGLIIVCSQLPALFGVALPHVAFAPYVAVKTVLNVSSANPVTALLGCGCVLLLTMRQRMTNALVAHGLIGKVGAKHLPKVLPLNIVIVGIALSAAFKLDTTEGMTVVGPIPQGLPPLSMPMFDIAVWQSLLPGAAMISLVAFVQSMAVAKALSRKRGESVDPNQELIAMGVANLAASVTSGYPVSSGLFRSAINIDAGAMTPLASMITAICMLLTLTLFGGALYHLPQTVLAAIVIASSFGLMSFKPFWRAWHFNRVDGVVFLVTFGSVLTFGIECGLACGIALSIGHFLWRTSRPKVSRIDPASSARIHSIASNTTDFGKAHTLFVRVGEIIYFGNAQNIEDEILELIAQHPGTRCCVLVLDGVYTIDASAIDVLEHLVSDLQRDGVTVELAGLKEHLRPSIATSQLLSCRHGDDTLGLETQAPPKEGPAGAAGSSISDLEDKAPDLNPSTVRWWQLLSRRAGDERSTAA